MSDQTDPEIFAHGKPVLMLAGPRSHTIEEWVQDVAAVSGTRTDWRLVGGRAIVLTLDNADRVRGVCEELWPVLIDAYVACTDNFGSPPFAPNDVQRLWLPEDAP